MKQPQGNTTIVVRLTPRSSRNEVVGWKDGALNVRVAAPPVDGKANAALLRLLAAALDVPVRRLSVTAGASARVKQVRVEGLDAEEARRRLA